MLYQVVENWYTRHRTEVIKLMKFSTVGVLNTAIDFTCFIVGTRFFLLHYLVASTIGWLLAVCVSFVINKYWTFGVTAREGTGRQYMRFIIVSGIALVWSTGLLYVFIEIFGFMDILAKVVTVGIVLFWNFFMNRYWTFKHT